MNLLKIYEQNEKNKKEFETVKNEIELQKEINKLIACVIEGRNEFRTNNVKIFEELGIKKRKLKEPKYCYIGLFSSGGDFYIKINETNIKKIQDYIDKKDVKDE